MVTLEFPDWVMHLRAKAEFASNDDLVTAARAALPESMQQGLNRRWLAGVLDGQTEVDDVPVTRWLALASALGVSIEELLGVKPGDGSPIAEELAGLQALMQATWE